MARTLLQRQQDEKEQREKQDAFWDTKQEAVRLAARKQKEDVDQAAREVNEDGPTKTPTANGENTDQDSMEHSRHVRRTRQDIAREQEEAATQVKRAEQEAVERKRRSSQSTTNMIDLTQDNTFEQTRGSSDHHYERAEATAVDTPGHIHRRRNSSTRSALSQQKAPKLEQKSYFMELTQGTVPDDAALSDLLNRRHRFQSTAFSTIHTPEVRKRGLQLFEQAIFIDVPRAKANGEKVAAVVLKTLKSLHDIMRNSKMQANSNVATRISERARSGSSAVNVKPSIAGQAAKPTRGSVISVPKPSIPLPQLLPSNSRKSIKSPAWVPTRSSTRTRKTVDYAEAYLDIEPIELETESVQIVGAKQVKQTANLMPVAPPISTTPTSTPPPERKTTARSILPAQTSIVPSSTTPTSTPPPERKTTTRSILPAQTSTAPSSTPSLARNTIVGPIPPLVSATATAPHPSTTASVIGTLPPAPPVSPSPTPDLTYVAVNGEEARDYLTANRSGQPDRKRRNAAIAADVARRAHETMAPDVAKVRKRKVTGNPRAAAPSRADPPASEDNKTSIVTLKVRVPEDLVSITSSQNQNGKRGSSDKDMPDMPAKKRRRSARRPISDPIITDGDSDANTGDDAGIEDAAIVEMEDPEPVSDDGDDEWETEDEDDDTASSSSADPYEGMSLSEIAATHGQPGEPSPWPKIPTLTLRIRPYFYNGLVIALENVYEDDARNSIPEAIKELEDNLPTAHRDDWQTKATLAGGKFAFDCLRHIMEATDHARLKKKDHLTTRQRCLAAGSWARLEFEREGWEWPPNSKGKKHEVQYEED